MNRLKRKLIWPLVLMLLLMLTAPAGIGAAQDAPRDTYVWEPAGLALDHPTDWVVRDDLMVNGGLSLGTNRQVLDSDVPGGELYMQVLPPLSTRTASLERYGVESITPASALDLLGIPAQGEPETLQLANSTAQRFEMESGALRVSVFVREFDTMMVVLYATATTDTFDQYEEAVRALTDSVRPSLAIPGGGDVRQIDRTPETAPNAETVAWQHSMAFEADDAPFRVTRPGAFGRLDVGSDDRVYVATGSTDLLVFDADGTLIHTLHNDGVRFDDVALAGDGTLWAIDRAKSRVFHLDADGNVLGGLGRVGFGVEMFTAGGPQAVTVGPDGAIYVLSTKPGDRTAEEVLVWEPDGSFVRTFTAGFRSGGLQDSSLLGRMGDDLLVGYRGVLARRYTVDGQELAIADAPDENYNASAITGATSRIFYAASDGTISRYTERGQDATFGTAQAATAAEEPFAPGELANPRGLGVLSDGDLIVADANDAYWQVVRFTIEDGAYEPEDGGSADEGSDPD